MSFQDDLDNMSSRGVDFLSQLLDPARSITKEQLAEILATHFKNQKLMQQAMGYADNGGAQLRKMLKGDAVPTVSASTLLLLIINEHPNFEIKRRSLAINVTTEDH